jgi:hypothetical protein
VKALAVLGGVAAVVVGLLLYINRAGQRPSSGGVPLIATAELSSARDAVTKGTNGITWYSPSLAPGSWPGQSAGQASAEAAIRGEAVRLAAVDYPALSLPDFKTETAAMAVQPDAFKSGQAWLDSRGVGQSGERWELYGWRGPEFPQKPGRPLVHRYVQIYALYDTNQKKVIKLLATIAGEAIE